MKMNGNQENQSEFTANIKKSQVNPTEVIIKSDNINWIWCMATSTCIWSDQLNETEFSQCYL